MTAVYPEPKEGSQRVPEYKFSPIMKLLSMHIFLASWSINCRSLPSHEECISLTRHMNFHPYSHPPSLPRCLFAVMFCFSTLHLVFGAKAPLARWRALCRSRPSNRVVKIVRFLIFQYFQKILSRGHSRGHPLLIHEYDIAIASTMCE